MQLHRVLTDPCATCRAVVGVELRQHVEAHVAAILLVEPVEERPGHTGHLAARHRTHNTMTRRNELN